MDRDRYYSNVKLHMPSKVIPLENYILHIEYKDGKTVNFDMKNLIKCKNNRN